MHMGANFGTEIKLFSGAFIFVEWFYVFSGYTLSKSVLESEKATNVAQTSFNLIWKRIIRIYPYYFLSCIVALIFRMQIGQIVINDSWDVYKILHDFLFLQMTGISVTCLTGTGWYLSSLWIAMIIIVPLLVKYRRYFSKLSIFIAIIIYIYIYRETGYMYKPDEWMLIGYKGNFRAIAALCIGISMYDYSSLIKCNLFSDAIKTKISILMNVISIIIYGFILYHINKVWVYSDITEISYFIIPFIFAILIAMQMRNNILADNKITKFLGTLSITIYMNHYYILEAIQFKYKDAWTLDEKVKYSLILSLGISVGIFLVVQLFNYVKKVMIRNSSQNR